MDLKNNFKRIALLSASAVLTLSIGAPALEQSANAKVITSVRETPQALRAYNKMVRNYKKGKAKARHHHKRAKHTRHARHYKYRTRAKKHVRRHKTRKANRAARRAKVTPNRHYRRHAKTTAHEKSSVSKATLNKFANEMIIPNGYDSPERGSKLAKDYMGGKINTKHKALLQAYKEMNKYGYKVDSPQREALIDENNAAAARKQINHYRSEYGKPAYTEDPGLDAIAQRRANHMANGTEAFSHYNSNGKLYADEDANALGIPGIYGENVSGATDAKEGNQNMMYYDAKSNWGHRKNILSDQYTKFGTGWNSGYLVEDFR